MTTVADKASPDPPPDAQQIRDILRQVIDPEVGRDIISLGLVYRVEPGPGRLLIVMTMTSPACPMGEMIMEDVHAALAKGLPDTVKVEVSLVWEPPWNPSMMDEASKQHFGWEPE